MSKIPALVDRLEQVKQNRLNQPPADALSLSLWELGAELSALDEEGIVTEAEALGISTLDIRNMAEAYSR